MTQTTIKEIKDYADELINLLGNLREMEDPKTWVVDFARLICEEMTVEKRVCGSEFPGCSIKNLCDGHEGYNCAAKVTEEKAQEILKALE